jgi:hypothetical protein
LTSIDSGALRPLLIGCLFVTLLLTLLVAVLYVLHQDIWFWRTARPLVFGFLPIGLAYHAAYSVAAALVLAVLVRFAWPGHLEAEVESAPDPAVPSEQGPRK